MFSHCAATPFGMEPQNNVLSGIRLEITEYIEHEILPRYDHFDDAHKVEHPRAVIADSIQLAKSCGVNIEMAYVIAAYHDTGMVDGRETHHLASGRIIMDDQNLRKWFTEEQILTMKEAVEDHLRFFTHIKKKYARGGYMHLWIQNSAKSRLLDELQELIDDEVQLRQTFDRLWNEIQDSEK